MPSLSYGLWTSIRASELDEMTRAHAAIGGGRRGRRFATQQINRAYAVLLASQFQGFCRDLHTECVDRLLRSWRLGASESIVRLEFHRGRQLDRGNAQPSSIGADFGRFGIDFWEQVSQHQSKSEARQKRLNDLNQWRNAIVHQTFDAARLGGTTTLRLGRVRRWRADCQSLAISFDAVMNAYLLALTGSPPW